MFSTPFLILCVQLFLLKDCFDFDQTFRQHFTNVEAFSQLFNIVELTKINAVQTMLVRYLARALHTQSGHSDSFRYTMQCKSGRTYSFAG